MLVRMGGKTALGPLISDDQVAQDALQGLGDVGQDLFGGCCCNPAAMGYYSSLLRQRAMMAPQATAEEAEMMEMGPYYGMNDIDEDNLRAMIIANRVAVPIWIIAGFFGDFMGNRTGSAISAVAGGVITANLATMVIRQDSWPVGGRFTLGALAAIAAFFTVSDTINVFKKRSDSPTFKTKLTRLTKAVVAPV